MTLQQVCSSGPLCSLWISGSFFWGHAPYGGVGVRGRSSRSPANILPHQRQAQAPASVSASLLTLTASSTRQAPVCHASRPNDLQRDFFCLSSGKRGSCRLGHERRLRGVATGALGGGPGASSSGGIESGGNEAGGDAVELPLFPLPMVLFPGSMVPLQVFEYRYRIMMHTLLQTDLRFGVIFATGKESGFAPAVGCVGHIVRHERLPDDRFFIVCKGEERFRVMDVVRTRPYLVGRVSWLEDRPSPSGAPLSMTSKEGEAGAGLQAPSDLDTLANEVATLMSNVIRLSRKVRGASSSPSSSASKGGGGSSFSQNESAPLDLRKSSFPTPFSFWVASTFEGAPLEQQALLEIVDTKERLERERETLRNTLNYLSAAVAVKDAFPSSSGESSSSSASSSS